MASVPFHYIDLRTFCYVTEDDQRVEDALRLFLPAEFEIERMDSEGHYGDRILVLSARVENASGMRTVLDAVADLPADSFARVRDELDDRVTEDCTFFLTLDKQSAYNGQVELGDGITLRAKVEAYPAKKPNAIETVEDALDDID
jgi:RNA binding exosome subunit